MSIPNLPVDFKDDILASSNTKRKYQQTFNSDGSMSLEDVTQPEKRICASVGSADRIT